MRKELIGYVRSEGGRLVIASPEMLRGGESGDIAGFLRRCDGADCNNAGAACVDKDECGRGSAVVSDCGEEGCSYPVAAEYDEGTGRLTRIVIDFEQDRVKYMWMGFAEERKAA